MAVGLIQWINDITFEKKYLFSPETERDFVPFIITRAMAQHIDTILFAEQVNRRAMTSRQHVHDFFFYALDRKKRYGKWAKKQKIDDQEALDAIMYVYSVSPEKAEQYHSVLTEDQIGSLISMHQANEVAIGSLKKKRQKRRKARGK